MPPTRRSDTARVEIAYLDKLHDRVFRFGFCREAIRRRVKPLVQCFCKRMDEE